MCIHTSLSSWGSLPPSRPTPLNHYRAQSWAPLYSSFLLACYRQFCLNGISSQARIQFRIMHCISLSHLPFLLQRGGLCNKKMSQTPGSSFQPWDLAPSLSSTRVCCVHRVCPPTSMLSHSLVSHSLWPHRLQPPRFLCPRESSRQEYWSGLPCLPPGVLPKPGI